MFWPTFFFCGKQKWVPLRKILPAFLTPSILANTANRWLTRPGFLSGTAFNEWFLAGTAKSFWLVKLSWAQWIRTFPVFLPATLPFLNPCLRRYFYPQRFLFWFSKLFCTETCSASFYHDTVLPPPNLFLSSNPEGYPTALISALLLSTLIIRTPCSFPLTFLFRYSVVWRHHSNFSLTNIC